MPPRAPSCDPSLPGVVLLQVPGFPDLRGSRTCTESQYTPLRRWALQASAALATGPNHLHNLQCGGRPPSRTPSEAAAANGQHPPCGLAVCWVWGFSRNQDSQVSPHGGYTFLPPGPSLARQVRNLQLSRGNNPNGQFVLAIWLAFCTPNSPLLRTSLW